MRDLVAELEQAAQDTPITMIEEGGIMEDLITIPPRTIPETEKAEDLYHMILTEAMIQMHRCCNIKVSILIL